MRSNPSKSAYFVVAGFVVLFSGTVVYRLWLGNLFYVDKWMSLSQEIDAATDIHNDNVQSLLKSVGDARFLGDLGLCYVLGDSLWIDGKNVSDTGVLYTFQVVNEEAGTVTIEDIATSCGCADAKMKTKVLSPGARAQLSLSISHEKLSDGPHNYWVTLKTSLGAVWRYGVKVNIVRAASWEQSDIYFGNASTPSFSREATAILRLFQPPYLKDMEFQGVQVSSDLVKATVLTRESSHAENDMTCHRFPVQLTLDPSGISRNGQGNCDVIARYSTGSQTFEVKERLHWEKVSAYNAVPARLVLRSSQEPTEPIRVVVSHATRVAFKIISVEAPAFISRSAEKSDRLAVEHELTFDVLRDKAPVKHEFTNLVVKTNMVGDDTMTIPLVFLRVPN